MKYNVSQTSSHETKLAFFNKYLKDPDNADRLVNPQSEYYLSCIAKIPNGPVTPGPTEQLLNDGDDQRSEGEGEDGVGGQPSTSAATTAYRELIFSDRMRQPTRVKIFLATMFLRGRLRQKANLNNPKYSFKLSREGQHIKDLAADLAAAMPMFTGVTGISLFAMYYTLINVSRVFNHIAERWTGGELPSSRMLSFVQDLLSIDNEIADRMNRRSKNKEAKALEDGNKEIRTAHASMSGLKKRGGRTHKSARTNPAHEVAYLPGHSQPGHSQPGHSQLGRASSAYPGSTVDGGGAGQDDDGDSLMSHSEYTEEPERTRALSVASGSVSSLFPARG
ncbi:hypothetical protein BGX33_008448 [Mortierella sp. NVP41]|nr:hypothetical protein BGX33_008448 [Mortierella sp. NVP41]